MKTKTTIYRVLAGLLVVVLVHVNGLSQNKAEMKMEVTFPMLMMSVYNQPLIFEKISSIENWMITDFAEFDETCYLIEWWMIDNEREFYMPEDKIAFSEWMMAEDFEDILEESEFMHWMLEFEPFILQELIIQQVETPIIEKWMFENEIVLDASLIPDFNVLKDWMIECFSMN